MQFCVLWMCCTILEKLLVLSGTLETSPQATGVGEVLDLGKESSTTCFNLTKYPWNVTEATGGLLYKNSPTVCGGLRKFKRDYYYRNGFLLTYLDVTANKCFSLQKGRQLIF